MRPQNANTPTANGQIYPDWGRPKGVVLPNCRYDEDVEGLAGQQVLGYCTPNAIGCTIPLAIFPVSSTMLLM